MNRHEKIGYGLLLSMFAWLLVTAFPAIAAPNIKEKGTLEAVEERGRSVVIVTRAPSVDKVVLEHRGTYQVSPYALIINGFGKKASLETFRLPAKIEFEVEYAAEGAIIKKIRELPQ